MKKISIFILTTIVLASCNSDKITQLEATITSKNDSIKQLKIEVNAQSEYINKLEEEKRKVRQYSDDEIIALVKKERNFYEPKVKREKFIVRKTNENRYQVRFEFYSSGLQMWRQSVYDVELFPENKYRVSFRSGAKDIGIFAN